MRKIYTKVKAVMKTLYNRIKPVIVNGIKLICEILRKIILLLSMLAFYIIPFMNSWLDNFTAQCVWYPALAVMVILLIREFVRKDGADSEETVVDHAGKWSFGAILFTFLSIFVLRYYNITYIWLWVIFGVVAIYTFLFFFVVIVL